MEPEKKIELPKRPTLGKQLAKYKENIITNYYKLNFTSKDRTFYQFQVELTPEIEKDSRKLIKKAVMNVESQIVDKIGPFILRGSMIWCFQKPPELTSFISKFKEKEVNHEFVIRLSKTTSFNMDQMHTNAKLAQQVIQVLNSYLHKKMMKAAGLEEMNKSSKFYDMTKETVVENSNLKVLKGYMTSIHLINGYPCVLIDVSTRVLRNETFGDTIAKSKNFYDFIGRSVVANYGNHRVYKIDEIRKDKTPLTVFECRGEKISYKEYYKKNYGINVKNDKQFLIQSSTKKKFLKDGKMVEESEEVFLIPYLVSLTGMEDDERKDFKLMQRMAEHTKMSPEERMRKIQDLFKKLGGASKNDLFSITPHEMSVEGFVLPEPTFEFGGNRTEVPKGGQLNFKQKLYRPVKLDRWVLAYTSMNDDDDRQADDLIYLLISAGKTFGIVVDKPRFVTATKKGYDAFFDALKQADTKYALSKYQMVIVFLNRNESGYYSKLKKDLLNKFEVNNQILKRETAQKKGMSAVSKVLLQINAKLGYPLWKIQSQHPNLKGKKVIVAGMAIYHKLVNGNKSCAAFVGTTNNDLNKYYSSSKLMPTNQQRFDSLQEIVINWVKSYCVANKTVPDYIFVYRYGVGEGSVQSILDLEVAVVKKAVEKIAEKMKIPNYNPGVAFILVNRKINQRLFSSSGKSKINNPEAGTVVGSGISSEGKFDFYIVPQFVNQGTATPTSFNVIYNTTDLPEDAFYYLTNEQCYSYFNWTGAVRVPAPLMYADRLAYLTGEHLKEEVKGEELKKLLYLL